MALPLMASNGHRRTHRRHTVPDVYTEAHLATGRQIADVIGPVIENIVLVHHGAQAAPAGCGSCRRWRASSAPA